MHPRVRVPQANCPHCGVAQDGASGLCTSQPQPGDVSICVECGGVSVYQDDMTREKWPCSEPLPPEVDAAQRIIRFFS
jgi:hypothetical protein